MNFKPNSELITKMVSRTSGIVLITIGVVALYMWRPVSTVAPPVPPARAVKLLSTQCLNHAARVAITVEAEASLLQLPHTLTERELIEMQLNYLRNSVLATYPEITHFSFTAEDKTLKVLRREETFTDLKTEFRFDTGMLEPVSPRLRQLIAQKEVAAGAPQRKVRYQAQAEAVICSDTPLTEPRELKIPLPQNPETAFWSVASADWQELRFKSITRTMNPCAEGELADLPQPEFYWYFWNPSRRISSDRTCRDLLSRRLTRADVRMVPLSTEDTAPPALSARRASLILGWLDTQYDATKELGAVAEAARRILKGEDGPGFRVGPGRDPSSLMLLETLSDIRRRAGENFDYAVREKGSSIEFTLEFEDRRELRIYWGPTDALGQVPARHYEFLARAMREDDILVYGGHASLGQSLTPTTENAAELTHTPGRRQLLAFFSCYSVNYLSHHDVKPWTSADQIYLITTASSMSRFTHASLKLLEPVISGQALDLTELTPANTWSDDQFVVNEIYRPFALEPVAERITQ